jgi:hypothetical protein
MCASDRSDDATGQAELELMRASFHAERVVSREPMLRRCLFASRPSFGAD